MLLDSITWDFLLLLNHKVGFKSLLSIHLRKQMLHQFLSFTAVTILILSLIFLQIIPSEKNCNCWLENFKFDVYICTWTFRRKYCKKAKIVLEKFAQNSQKNTRNMFLAFLCISCTSAHVFHALRFCFIAVTV